MIDSHHHLWNFTLEEFSWIEKDEVRRSFLAPELDRLLQDNQVSGAISVQARTCLEENDFLLEQAASSSTIKGVVGWVDLKSSEAGTQLDHYAANPLFKGVREITQGATDADFLANDSFNAGIREITARDLTYDVLIFQNQLKAATDFIDQHPNQSFVLDHAAKPEIRTSQFPDTWADEISEISKRDNLACKLSGLVTEVRDDAWNTDLMRPYFETLLESFGPTRIMFGSDWPVCLLASEYGHWKNCVLKLISELSPDEQHAITTGTATTFYSI